MATGTTGAPWNIPYPVGTDTYALTKDITSLASSVGLGLSRADDARVSDVAALNAAVADRVTNDELAYALDAIATAYDVAVADGYTGTQTQWLASLKGDTGPAGPYGGTSVTDPQVASWVADTGTQTGSLISNRHRTYVSVREYGAKGDGVTNDATAINAAINAVTGAGGGDLFFPSGTYLINSSVLIKNRVTLVGAGTQNTVIRASASVTTAVVLGTSGTAVQDAGLRGITIDGGYDTTTTNIAGVQVSNARRLLIDAAQIRNTGSSGVVLGSSLDTIIRDSVIDGTGLYAGTGHGISISSGSHRTKVRGCRILRGLGMGIYGGTASNPSTEIEITGCHITNDLRMPGLECIGLTAGCDKSIVIGNHLMASHDNGLSLSCSDSTAGLNVIDSPYRSGVACAGSHNTIIGNRIRNVGQDGSGLAWGGISLSSSQYCTVVGNVVYDDQATPTTAYAIKEQDGGNYNTVMGNTAHGFTTSEMLRAGANTLAIVGQRINVTGSRGGNAAVTSLLAGLATAGLVNNQTTA